MRACQMERERGRKRERRMEGGSEMKRETGEAIKRPEQKREIERKNKTNKERE